MWEAEVFGCMEDEEGSEDEDYTSNQVYEELEEEKDEDEEVELKSKKLRKRKKYKR